MSQTIPRSAQQKEDLDNSQWRFMFTSVPLFFQF
jgi:hypothetical protein